MLHALKRRLDSALRALMIIPQQPRFAFILSWTVAAYYVLHPSELHHIHDSTPRTMTLTSPSHPMQDVSLPLPFTTGPRLSKPLPLVPPGSPSPPATVMDDDPDPHYLRSATASPPPLFLPSPAVSQAQLAFLFGAGALPDPSESVHFAPQPQAHAGADHGKGRPRRGTLRISTEASAGADAGMRTGTGTGTGPVTGTGTWFRRIRAGFSQGV